MWDWKRCKFKAVARDALETSPSCSRAYDSQSERLLKTIEILVPVQQFVLGLQTESSDQAIDRLANGIAPLTQLSIVLRGGNGELAPTS